MRNDMHELLVERPRGGSHLPNEEVRAARLALRAARAHDTWDALPRPTGRPHRGRCRHLNENLAPLTRFLGRRVGRPWDEVFSELRTQLDMRSPIQLHIMQHLWQFVALKVERGSDGRWYRTTGWARGWPVRTDGRHFYVDPRTGRLMRPRPPRAEAPPRRPDHHRGADGQIYARIEGVWWAVTVGRLPRWQASGEAPVDVLLKAPATAANGPRRAELYGDEALFATTRRSLNRRELRALGLWRTRG